MAWMDIFRANKPSTAQLAKERLQVIVAHQRAGHLHAPDYLPKLQKELLDVIRKYVAVGEDAVNIEVERDGDTEILELNITVPSSKS
ncbi:cell division topological specificity factor MinE [Abyssibacter sp.]|jgi:cell division topological specificity factor|uniref:cell division topological specificity factor MinE n=1 Tax=Abyssibacter sp. TaxID=2320200 RepID=UPI000C5D6A95|nr:cell division topological specificity factor MinE [Abyssibacter sp.]MBB88231.1 cell division topological specificity factor MinE [Xanthomonadales bacterium]MCK5860373.1 cell division topological specificity factor MinE [Abyssibacter sp.]